MIVWEKILISMHLADFCHTLHKLQPIKYLQMAINATSAK